VTPTEEVVSVPPPSNGTWNLPVVVIRVSTPDVGP
jgi:hypothetical protein